MSSSFNSVDYFIIFIFSLSMLIGFMRGLLKEIISLVSWLAATAVSTLFSSKLASLFGGAAPSAAAASSALQGASQGNYTSMIALGISFVVLFIATLFAGYLVNIIVVGIFQGPYISITNRMLGALFGMIRGSILVIIFMFVAELTPMGVQRAWTDSHLVQAFAPTVKWFQDLVQPGLDLIRSKASGAIETIKENAPSSSGIMNGVTGGASDDSGSYSTGAGQ